MQKTQLIPQALLAVHRSQSTASCQHTPTQDPQRDKEAASVGPRMKRRNSSTSERQMWNHDNLFFLKFQRAKPRELASMCGSLLTFTSTAALCVSFNPHTCADPCSTHVQHRGSRCNFDILRGRPSHAGLAQAMAEEPPFEGRLKPKQTAPGFLCDCYPRRC